MLRLDGTTSKLKVIRVYYVSVLQDNLQSIGISPVSN